MNKQNIIRGNREISTSKISSINDLEITRMLQMSSAKSRFNKCNLPKNCVLASDFKKLFVKPPSSKGTKN